MTRYNVAMAIVIHLDRLMAEKKVSLNELSERVGISISNLSKMKTGKIRAVRFSTLEAICIELDCQPGDLIEFRTDCGVRSGNRTHHTEVFADEM